MSPDLTPSGKIATKTLYRQMRKAELAIMQFQTEMMRRELQIEETEERIITDKEGLIALQEQLNEAKKTHAELKNQYEMEDSNNG